MRKILDEMRLQGDFALAELLELQPESDRPETVQRLLVSIWNDSREASEEVHGRYYLYFVVLLGELELPLGVRMDKIIAFHKANLPPDRYYRDVSLRKQIMESIIHLWSKAVTERDVAKAMRWLLDVHILADQRLEDRKGYIDYLERVVRGIPYTDIAFKTIYLSLKTLINYKWAARDSMQSFLLLLMQIRDRKLLRGYSWPQGPQLLELLEGEEAFILSHAKKK